MKADEVYELVGMEGDFQQPQEESKLGSGFRNLIRTDSRILESLVGTPGDIAQGVLGLGNLASEKLTGYRPLPEKIPFLPTTEQVRGVTQSIAPDYLTPQSSTEEGMDEFVQDLTSILHPVGGPVSKVRAGVGVAATGLGHLAKFGGEKFGLNKNQSEGLKIGTMLLTSLGAQPALKKIATDSLNKAAERLPFIHKNLDAKAVEKVIKKIDKITKGSGAATPSKDFLRTRSSELNKLIDANGKIKAKDAYQYARDINEFFSENSIPKNAQGLMGELISSLDGSLSSLKNSHPEFWNSYKSGKDIYKNIHTSSAANEFIKNIADKANKKFLSPLTTYLFGLPSTIAGSLAASGIKTISDNVDRIIRSPSIRDTYAHMVSSAIKEQAGPTARYLDKLDKLFSQQQFKQEPDQFELIGYEGNQKNAT